MKFFLNVLCVVLYIKLIFCQDVSVIINSKKSMHIVDERFISVVIDPVILMSGLNISSQTFNLAKHFAPAFFRIHGPSTTQIVLSNEKIESSQSNDQAKNSNLREDLVGSSGNLMLTPSMWTSLNEWIISANLTPVFALSDHDRVNDAWNPKATALPLMELTDKMNITCYWELTNDIPGKTLKQYSDDVVSLRHILDAFPTSRKSWYTIAGDFSMCAPSENMDVTKRLVTNIASHVQALDYTRQLDSIYYPATTKATTPFARKLQTPSAWITAPRTAKPTSFEAGLIWAKQLGEAATNGYDVVFRQPKIRELFELTPAYWVSAFHKILMGRNVLGVRQSGLNHKENCHIYANCAKRQNRFTRRGAATVFVVNEGNAEVNASVKFLGTPLKNVEIQSYILTSTDEDSSETYLNGQLLTISDLYEGRIEYMPKLRRARASKALLLTLPRKSIGFFVIPAARLTTCIHGEEDLQLIHQEMYNDQHERWNNEELESDDASESTSKATETVTSVQDLFRILAEELDSNEKYYKNRSLLKMTREWLEQAEAKLDGVVRDATDKDAFIGRESHDTQIGIGKQDTQYGTQIVDILQDGTQFGAQTLMDKTLGDGTRNEKTLKEEIFEYIPPIIETEPKISDGQRKLMLLKEKRLQTQNKILNIEQRRAALKQLLNRKKIDIPEEQKVEINSPNIENHASIYEDTAIHENDSPRYDTDSSPIQITSQNNTSNSLETNRQQNQQMITKTNLVQAMSPILYSPVTEPTTNLEPYDKMLDHVDEEERTVQPVIEKHFSGLFKQFSAFNHPIQRKKRNLPSKVNPANNNEVDSTKRISGEDYMVNVDQNHDILVEPNNDLNNEEECNYCGCQHCNKYGLAFVKNLLKKLLSSAKGIKNSVEEKFVKRSTDDSQEKRDNHIHKNRDQDKIIVTEMKTIAKEFENEVYNLLNSARRKYDSSATKIVSKENEDYESKLDHLNRSMRQKRSLSERLKDKRDTIRSKIELQRAKLRNNWINKRNRTKREVLRKKLLNDINSDRKLEHKTANYIKKIDSEEFTPIPEQSVTKLSPLQDQEDGTAMPVTMKPVLPIVKNNSRLKMLNRRLAQQKKLEERLAAYLKKIKQSNKQLFDEIKRNKRSTKLENFINDIDLGYDDSIYPEGFKMDDLNREILNKLKSHHDFIVKREIQDINRTNKLDYKQNQEENDIYTNEIPKTENMKSDWSSENEVDNAYMIIKPKLIPVPNKNDIQEIINEVPKHGKMESDWSKENENDTTMIIMSTSIPKVIQNSEPEATMNEIRKEGMMKSDWSKENEDDSVYMVKKLNYIQNNGKEKISNNKHVGINENKYNQMNKDKYDKNPVSNDPGEKKIDKEIKLEKSVIPNNNEGDNSFDTILGDFLNKIMVFINFLTQ